MLYSNDIIKLYAKKIGKSRDEARELFYTLISVIKDAVYDDNEGVELRGLCVFTVYDNEKMRITREIHRTGGEKGECISPPKKRIGCTISEKWKKHINGSVSSFEEKPGQKKIIVDVDQTLAAGYPEVDMFGILRPEEPIGRMKKNNIEPGVIKID